MNEHTNLLKIILTTANRYPDHIALIIDEEQVSYGELISLAQSWAASLLSKSNNTSLKRVAVIANRSLVSYVGLLAAMMVGAAFVPMNPKLPMDRNLSIFEQSQPDALITDNVSFGYVSMLLTYTEVSMITLNTDQENINYTKVNRIMYPNLSNNHELYVLFTSGSTGQPKGVPITHGNLMTFLQHCQQRYQVTPLDRFSQTFEATFDLFMFDVFMAWCHGACVVGMRAIDLLSPSRYINNNGITIWFSVPSVISLLQRQRFLSKGAFPSLRLSLFCGEKLYQSQIEAWADAAPNAVCENLYGPTELTVACTAFRYQRNVSALYEADTDVVSIGQTFPSLDYIFIDDEDNFHELEGELCVSGPQCFSGYLNHKSSMPTPFITFTDKYGIEKKYYRTGDRVRLNSHNDLEYIGRKDQQVKINGYRVELNDIESVLLRLEGLEQVVAIYFTDEFKLVVCIVGHRSKEDILSFARKSLPVYMVPSEIYFYSNFPLNNNGKIDRSAIFNGLTLAQCA